MFPFGIQKLSSEIREFSIEVFLSHQMEKFEFQMFFFFEIQMKVYDVKVERIRISMDVLQI